MIIVSKLQRAGHSLTSADPVDAGRAARPDLHTSIRDRRGVADRPNGLLCALPLCIRCHAP
jgi:hypothetical protein